jgi:hypothetical protein
MSSDFLKKNGKRLGQFHESIKAEEVQDGYAQLPAGIVNGIAQLTDAKIGQYQSGVFKDEFYFQAKGRVVEPAEHNGAPVRGALTMIMEPLCDTPSKKRKTLEEHYKFVVDTIKSLSVDIKDTSIHDLDTIIEAVKEARPYFRFSTWIGKPTAQQPNPQVQSQWHKAVEYEPAPVERSDAYDEVDESPASAGGVKAQYDVGDTVIFGKYFATVLEVDITGDDIVYQIQLDDSKKVLNNIPENKLEVPF